MNTDFRKVSSRKPCTICDKPDWCSYTTDGKLAICRRLDTGEGFHKTDVNGADYWVYILDSNAKYDAADLPLSPLEPKAERSDPDTLNVVYQALLEELPLTTTHKKNLRNRGLSYDAIKRRGYRSMSGKGRASIALKLADRFGRDKLLKFPGFYIRQENSGEWISIAGSEGIWIPVRDKGQRVVGILIRIDKSREGSKYIWLSSVPHGGPGPGAQVHVPLHDGLNTDSVRLTEGALKADIATELSGVLTIGLPGVSVIRPALSILKSKSAKQVTLAFDSDAHNN